MVRPTILVEVLDGWVRAKKAGPLPVQNAKDVEGAGHGLSPSRANHTRWKLTLPVAIRLVSMIELHSRFHFVHNVG